MLLSTDGGLCAIRMVRPQHLTQGSEQLTTVAGQSDVILLVNSLQLGVETANHHILETIGLDLSPVINLVRWDILGIASHVVRSVGIGTLSTNGSHQLVVLVRNKVLGSNLTH